MRVAHRGQLLVGALDLARVPAREMDEDFEQQREGQGLGMIERACVTASRTAASPRSGNPRLVSVREYSHRQKTPGSIPVSQTRAR
jgi:hypothetical protein